MQAVSDNITLEECSEILKLIEDMKLPYCQYILYKKLADMIMLKQRFEEAFSYYTMAMDILNDNNFKAEQIKIYNNMGICMLKLLRYDEAIYYFNSAITLCNSTGVFDVYLRALHNLSLAYTSILKLDDALDCIYKAYEELNKQENKPLYVKLKIIEASCYDSKRDFQRCIEVYKELLKDKKDINDVLLGTIYNNMAIVMLKNKNYKESEAFFDRAYMLRYEQAPETISHVIIESAALYYETGDMDKFHSKIALGIELCRQHNDYGYLIEGLMQLEKAYASSGETDKLRKVYLELLEISEKHSLRQSIISSLNKLIGLEIRSKNFAEAYKYNEKLNSYYEDIVNM